MSAAGRTAEPTAGRTARRDRVLFTLLVIGVGTSLRLHLGTVPALKAEIETSLGLGTAAFGLLSSVAVVSMGLAAPLGPWLSARLGAERAVGALLGVLAVGGLVRLAGDTPGVLFGAAALAGVGMGAVSSLVPGLVARAVPGRAGLTTGLYSSSMAVGVALAALLSRPLADLLGGWERSLASWGVLAAVTALVWSWRAPSVSARLGSPAGPVVRRASGRMPLRSPVAWLVTLVVTTPMTIGLTGVAWIDPLAQERGLAPADAALVFAVFQLVQLLSLVGVPALLDRHPDPRRLACCAHVVSAAGLLLLLVPHPSWVAPAACLVGLGIGGATSLGLWLIGSVGGSQDAAGRLGAMCLLVAFGGGAAGPAMLGVVRERTDGYAVGLVALAVLAAVTAAASTRLRPGLRLEVAAEPPVGARAGE